MRQWPEALSWGAGLCAFKPVCVPMGLCSCTVGWRGMGLAVRSSASQGGRHVADAAQMLWAEDRAGELGLGFLGAGRFCRPHPPQQLAGRGLSG